LVAGAIAADGRVFECQVDPDGTSNFSLAMFKAWVPAEPARVKGVLVVAPPSEAEGRPMADDAKWHAVASRWNYALVAVTFTSNGYGVPYYRAECGSGQALLTALDRIAVASGHEELREPLPVAILGHSQGGQFAFHFACWHPERTVAFAAIKGGYYDAKPTDAARAVPGLLITAEKDDEFRRHNLRALFEANNTPASRWAFESEPNAGHEVARSLDLILPFFDAVISRKIEPFAGNPSDGTVYPAGELLPKGCAWLPNEEVARIWSQYLKGTIPPDEQVPGISSGMPAPIAEVTGAPDLGNLEDGQEVPTVQYQVGPVAGGPQWTAVRAYARHDRCEVSVSGSGQKWTISVRPKLSQLPLGRNSESIVIRCTDGETTVPGGAEMGLNFNHVSPDLKLSSSSIYCGVSSEACQRSLTLTARNGKKLKVSSAEVIKGFEPKFSVVQTADDSARIDVDFPVLEKSGNRSGILSVHLLKPVDSTLLIPLIGYYQQNSPDGKGRE
jgi:pimeloyl-ACP methyl ester carboxylesterase